MNDVDSGSWGEKPRGAVTARRTLIFANDKSSGKTTSANAVLVALLERYPSLMRTVAVREYDRQPRLATVFRPEDGFGSVQHVDARNAAAYDRARELAYDPNATQYDELLYLIGRGGLIVDLGANIFSDICRILDDEPRPVFPDGGESVGVVVPVTTAFDSIDSAIFAVEAAMSWGQKVRIFVIEQEYLGRFTDQTPGWMEFRDRLARFESNRATVLRVEKLPVADIGHVVFQRIDRMLVDAHKVLQATHLVGADYIRTIRQARSELAWGAKTLESVRVIADWYAQ